MKQLKNEDFVRISRIDAPLYENHPFSNGDEEEVNYK